MLNAREPRIINGPQILDKYVGESEAKIRELFAAAEEEEKKVCLSSIVILFFPRFTNVSDLDKYCLIRICYFCYLCQFYKIYTWTIYFVPYYLRLIILLQFLKNRRVKEVAILCIRLF